MPGGCCWSSLSEAPWALAAAFAALCGERAKRGQSLGALDRPVTVGQESELGFAAPGTKVTPGAGPAEFPCCGEGKGAQSTLHPRAGIAAVARSSPALGVISVCCQPSQPSGHYFCVLTTPQGIISGYCQPSQPSGHYFCQKSVQHRPLYALHLPCSLPTPEANTAPLAPGHCSC